MNQVISKTEYEAIREKNCLFVFAEKPDEAISLNTILARKIKEVSPGLRAIKLQKVFEQVLDELPGNPIICDIDVLFNPAYRVDVLKILTETDKQKNFTLVWPGIIEDGRLIYGEEGYADFKSYNMSDYNIICVE